MIGLKQTLVGGPDDPPEKQGDCGRACLCSLLELPLDAIGNHHGEGWVARVNADLGRYGWWKVGVELDPCADWYAENLENWISPGYWIAGVTSLNLSGTYPDSDRPLQHVVVMHGREVAWDPALRKTYDIGTSVEDLEVWAASWLVPLVPGFPAHEPRGDRG